MKKAELLPDLILYTQTPEDKELRANTYLLLGDKPILIDAGFSVKEPVAEVVLTHCHGDHAIFCNEYKKRGAKIMISEADAPHLAACDEVMQPGWAKDIFGPANPVRADVVLNQGDRIKNSNWDLEVISVPGHTPGGIALFDRKKGILFSGDTLFADGKFGSWNHPGGDQLELTKSVLKLKNIKYKMLCSGHSEIKWSKKWNMTS